MQLVTFLIIFILIFAAPSSAFSQQVFTTKATLVAIVDTSKWSPASPDPSGIDYWSAQGSLLVSDSEVEEMPNLFKGFNVFAASIKGVLGKTFTTTSFSNEPTGLAVNPQNGHLFISDDNKFRIFEVDLGADNSFGTADDVIRSFATAVYGISDPEGLSYGAGSLFVADGMGRKVFQLSPGANGLFEGPAPTGDDLVQQFDTAGMGQTDPEGIAYNPDKNSLYIVSRNSKVIVETTVDGSLLGRIDISALNAVGPAGLAYGPSSLNPATKSLYIAARGVDNNANPQENDGKIYEISVAITNLSCQTNPRQLACFEAWRSSFTSGTYSADADMNANATVTLSDFEVWRRAYTGI